MLETFTSHNPLPEMYELYEMARKDPRNRLPDNYTEDRVFTDDTLLYSITLENNRPVLGSTVVVKPIYNGMARALTRLYLVGGTTGLVPRKTSNGQYIPISLQLEQQVKKAKTHNIHDIFVSREDKHEGRLKRINHGFNSNTCFDWTLTHEEYWTCNDKCQACSQRIFYTGSLNLKRNEDVSF